MKFKTFQLDKFQEDAIKSVNKNNSVLVSAGTGTGKTLIADYVIDKFLKQNKRIIYTAPIKALSAQKFRDFTLEYGRENVGMMTGDIVINSDAPILIMTTEIYRNILLARDMLIDHVSYVIFDEIHYINDIERGTIWEESIIFSPDRIRFVCLSATIPNAKEFADWISTIKEHVVDVIIHNKRAVPLEHNVYDKYLGITTVREIEQDRSIDAAYLNPWNRNKSKKRWQQKEQSKPDHLALVREIQNNLPCIFFSFSRKDCEKKATDLSKKTNYLTDKERKTVVQFFNSMINREYKSLLSVQKQQNVLRKGVAFHHAGVLPKVKEIIELLFSKGLVKVLYATETFSVGINMPAKTVCFSAIQKYDGISFRYLNSKEYFQMAGRAGRRGLDKIGHSIIMVDRRLTDLSKIKKISEKDDIPIISQFKLSTNTVLNLIKHHTQEEQAEILKKNFDYYLRKKKSKKQVRIMASYNNKVNELKKQGFIGKKGLTRKGDFASKIYAQEILISEIFCSHIWQKFSVIELNIVLASIIYEPREKDHFNMDKIKKTYNKIMSILTKNSYLNKNIKKLSLKRMINIVGEFSAGEEFTEVLSYANFDEGDFIRLFRRIVDAIRQIRHATDDHELRDRLTECQNLVYRDIVKFDF